jgi:hypothetical protein
MPTELQKRQFQHNFIAYLKSLGFEETGSSYDPADKRIFTYFTYQDRVLQVWDRPYPQEHNYQLRWLARFTNTSVDQIVSKVSSQ